MLGGIFVDLTIPAEYIVPFVYRLLATITHARTEKMFVE